MPSPSCQISRRHRPFSGAAIPEARASHASTRGSCCNAYPLTRSRARTCAVLPDVPVAAFWLAHTDDRTPIAFTLSLPPERRPRGVRRRGQARTLLRRSGAGMTRIVSATRLLPEHSPAPAKPRTPVSVHPGRSFAVADNPDEQPAMAPPPAASWASDATATLTALGAGCPRSRPAPIRSGGMIRTPSPKSAMNKGLNTDRNAIVLQQHHPFTPAQAPGLRRH